MSYLSYDIPGRERVHSARMWENIMYRLKHVLIWVFNLAYEVHQSF